MLVCLCVVASEKKKWILDGDGGMGGWSWRTETAAIITVLHERNEKKKRNRIKQMQCSQHSQTTGHDRIRDNHKKKEQKK